MINLNKSSVSPFKLKDGPNPFEAVGTESEEKSLLFSVYDNSSSVSYDDKICLEMQQYINSFKSIINKSLGYVQLNSLFESFDFNSLSNESASTYSDALDTSIKYLKDILQDSASKVADTLNKNSSENPLDGESLDENRVYIESIVKDLKYIINELYKCTKVSYKYIASNEVLLEDLDLKEIEDNIKYNQKSFIGMVSDCVDNLLKLAQGNQQYLLDMHVKRYKNNPNGSASKFALDLFKYNIKSDVEDILFEITGKHLEIN